jgi:hypothetical protein
VRVAANKELGTEQFCAARFEMKHGHGHPTSRAEGKPWNDVSRNQAIELCKSMGERYSLITNRQWQAIAREIN